MRVKQKIGTRGSLMWMQRLIDHPGVLESALTAEGALSPGKSLRWLSPRQDDDWAAYRDNAFLACIGRPDLSPALAAFWPSRGPQWDGLAVDDKGGICLIEAKAHAGELASTCQASPSSRALIAKAMAATKAAYGISQSDDWLEGYYQYANRLAHLFFLRSQDVDAHLVFLYFTNDADMRRPTSKEAWKAATVDMLKHLGFADGQQPEGVHSVFVDTRLLT